MAPKDVFDPIVRSLAGLLIMRYMQNTTAIFIELPWIYVAFAMENRCKDNLSIVVNKRRMGYQFCEV